MREFEVPHRSIPARGIRILKVAGGRFKYLFAVPAEASLCRYLRSACRWAGFIRNGIGTVNNAQKQDPARKSCHNRFSLRACVSAVFRLDCAPIVTSTSVPGRRRPHSWCFRFSLSLQYTLLSCPVGAASEPRTSASVQRLEKQGGRHIPHAPKTCTDGFHDGTNRQRDE